jgi:hypothetical protein
MPEGCHLYTRRKNLESQKEGDRQIKIKFAKNQDEIKFGEFMLQSGSE